MESVARVGTRPVSLPLLAEDVVEFHAARLLLLLEICGTAGKIDGLTKMAKLDFFARYPEFFAVAKAAATPTVAVTEEDRNSAAGVVESAMVRHHYGPWDKRYYHVLAHLESRALISVSPEGKSYRLALTPLGRETARALASTASFGSLVERMRDVKSGFGGKSGTYLKNLIYQLFDEEVGRLPLGEEIR